jgi:hypothetical protein
VFHELSQIAALKHLFWHRLAAAEHNLAVRCLLQHVLIPYCKQVKVDLDTIHKFTAVTTIMHAGCCKSQMGWPVHQGHFAS